MDIKAYLEEKREFIDSYLKSYFETPSSPPILHEAMKYSLFARRQENQADPCACLL